MKTIFKNATLVLPNRTIGSGDVVMEGDRITHVGPLHGEVAADARCIDCSGKLVMPGLVNAHGHTPMTLLRGVGGGLPLQRWLQEAIFPLEAKLTAEDVAAGARWGALEMFAGGITQVADMYAFQDATEREFQSAGLKASLSCVGLAFGDNDPPGCLEACIAYVAKGCEAKINRDFCVHSEYLTTERFCRELAAANREFHRPVHIHVSETEREQRECLARHGKTPIAYLADTGLLDWGGYVAHGVYCTDDDFRIMRDYGVSLVHNPSSNMKLGSGFARIPAALAAGVNVALGTDGCASNDNLNLFEEMHLAALIHKGLAKDPSVLSSWDVIEMATVYGARALGRTDTGEIAVGKRADFCIVDLDRAHLLPRGDIAGLIVYAMQAGDVVMTVVDGQIVYDGGRFSTVDGRSATTAFLNAVARIRA